MVQNQFAPPDKSRFVVRPLASTLAILAGLVRIVPHPYNLTPVGALGIYSGARLCWWQAFTLPILVMAGTDVLLYQLAGKQPFDPFVYGSFLVYVLLGRLLRNTESPGKIILVSLLATSQFFLISNFGVWLSNSQKPGGMYYPASLETLGACYAAALPFFQGEPPAHFVRMAPPLGFFGNMFLGDLAFSLALFCLHARLSRRIFPAEQINFGRATY